MVVLEAEAEDEAGLLDCTLERLSMLTIWAGSKMAGVSGRIIHGAALTAPLSLRLYSLPRWALTGFTAVHGRRVFLKRIAHGWMQLLFLSVLPPPPSHLFLFLPLTLPLRRGNVLNALLMRCSLPPRR